jgi:hypothetical protein
MMPTACSVAEPGLKARLRLAESIKPCPVGYY